MKSTNKINIINIINIIKSLKRSRKVITKMGVYIKDNKPVTIR